MDSEYLAVHSVFCDHLASVMSSGNGVHTCTVSGRMRRKLFYKTLLYSLKCFRLFIFLEIQNVGRLKKIVLQ